MNRTAVAVVAVCVVLGLTAAGFGYQRQERTIDAIERESELREASQCLNAHEARVDIRAGIDKAATAGAEALIIVVGADVDPATVEAYRDAIAEQAEAARAEIPDPDCDLDAAQAVLDE